MPKSHSSLRTSSNNSGGCLPRGLPPPSEDLFLEPLAYRYPIRLAIVYGPMVLIATWIFLAASFRTSEEVYWKVAPAYLVRLATESMEASADGQWYFAVPLSLLCTFCYYMEQLVAVIAQFLAEWISKGCVTTVMPMFIFMNVFEFGSTVRMLRRCPGAMAESYLLYGVGALLFGFTQRVSLEMAIGDFNDRALELLAKLEKVQEKEKGGKNNNKKTGKCE